MSELPISLRQFVNESKWIFAKTYVDSWPHEYIVKENTDNDLFLKLAKHIDIFGHEEPFYSSIIVYFYHENHVYWHMENIINRCLQENTYKNRLKDNRLPKGYKY